MSNVSITPLLYEEYDPDIEYEDVPPNLLPPGVVGIDAVVCCDCVQNEGNMCAIEDGYGEIISLGSAQLFGYWYW